jgi:signal transduction histidine kinase
MIYLNIVHAKLSKEILILDGKLKIEQNLTQNEITMEEWERRKQFVNFTQEDVKLLKQLHPLCLAHSSKIMEALYDWIMQFEETKKFIMTNEMLIHLKSVQEKYFLGLTAGDYGEQYLIGRLRIGRVHHKVGLEPRWYLGTYAIYIQLILREVMREFQDKPNLILQMISALSKIFTLDQELAMVAYIRPIEDTIKQQKEIINNSAFIAHTGRLAALGELSTGVAHELNQPLSIIRTNMQSLEFLGPTQLSESDFNNMLSSTIKQVDRATKIISHMCSFARGKMMPAELVAISNPIKAALSMFNEQFRLHEVNITLNIEDNLPEIHAVEQEIEQIIVNLLSNAKHAVEAMRDKSGKGFKMSIIINVMHNKTDKTIDLEIIDNGIGMSKETLEHCYEPFYTVKGAGIGTGLGLSIVYSIVQQLSGKVIIESEVDHGTKFTIKFPDEL